MRFILVRDGRRADPRPWCRAPLGPMARLGSLPDPWFAAPSDDRLPQGVEGGEARIDLRAEDRNLPGGFDAEAHLAVTQLHHRHDDPLADRDPLTELARQDQHGGLLP